MYDPVGKLSKRKCVWIDGYNYIHPSNKPAMGRSCIIDGLILILKLVVRKELEGQRGE